MADATQRSPLCKHGFVVCSRCVVITDAAKRMSDLINLKMVCFPWDTICHTFMAFALEDGSSDNVLYDTWEDCRRHQKHRATAIFFMRNALGGANARDCQIYLNVHRHAYENNRDFAEPAQSIIVSTRSHDIMSGRVNPYAN